MTPCLVSGDTPSSRSNIIFGAPGKKPSEWWREIPEGPDADPALHARYADLAILGQLDPDRAETELIRPRPEQVALASGRPVLIAPYAGHFDNVGRRVLIAWNATREAARAVSDGCRF